MHSSRRGLSRKARTAPDQRVVPGHGTAPAQPAGEQPANADAVMSLREKVEFIEWHISRHDQLRVSASSRASIVLSACAILSAGDAVILSQLLGSPADVKGWVLAVLSAGIAASAALVVVTVILSTSALISVRSSSKRFPDDDRPVGLLFHAAHTVRRIHSFPQFRAFIEAEHYGQVLEQAEVELWLAMQHYMYRYGKLRGAVIAFRGAAVTFVCVLTASVAVNLVHRF